MLERISSFIIMPHVLRSFLLSRILRMKSKCGPIFLSIPTVLMFWVQFFFFCWLLNELTSSISLDVTYAKNPAFMKIFLIVVSVTFFSVHSHPFVFTVRGWQMCKKVYYHRYYSEVSHNLGLIADLETTISYSNCYWCLSWLYLQRRVVGILESMHHKHFWRRRASRRII